MAESKSAESANAPIDVSDSDPYIGVSPEYRNSPDHLGKPLLSGDSDVKRVQEDAIDDEKSAVVPAAVYGRPVDEDGNPIKVDRMGSKPKGDGKDSGSVEPQSAYGDEDASKSTGAPAPAPSPSPSPKPTP